MIEKYLKIKLYSDPFDLEYTLILFVLIKQKMQHQLKYRLLILIILKK